MQDKNAEKEVGSSVRYVFEYGDFLTEGTN